jgi:hypothetical protein
LKEVKRLSVSPTQVGEPPVSVSGTVSRETLEYLESIALNEGRSIEEIAGRAVDEYVRSMRFPGIRFVGSTRYGRKAVVEGAPAVWSIVFTTRNHGMDLKKTAEFLQIPVEKVKQALEYYAAYPDETDSRLEQMTEFEEDPQRFCPSIRIVHASDLENEASA